MSWDQQNSGSQLVFVGAKVSEADDKWTTAYSLKTFTEGKHEWKVKVDSSSLGSLFVGVTRSTRLVDSYMVSLPIRDGDVITVVLDLCNRTVSFKKNNTDPGIAFDNLPDDVEYRFAVSLKKSCVTCVNYGTVAYSPPTFDEACDPIMLKLVNTADGSETIFPTYRQVLAQRGNTFENILGGDHETKEIKLKLPNFECLDFLVFYLQTGTTSSPFGSLTLCPMSPKALISLVYVADYIGSETLLHFVKRQFSDLERAKVVAADPDFSPDLIKDHFMKILFPNKFSKDSPWNEIMKQWLSRDTRKSYVVQVMETLL